MAQDESIWKQIQPPEPVPIRLSANDECYYLREFTSRGGYSASTTNQLISNFKKPGSRRASPEWKHKLRACKQFAMELYPLITQIAAKDRQNYYFTWIPSSKSTDDPEYCQRFELMFDELVKLIPDISVVRSVHRSFSVESAHRSASRAEEDEIEQSLVWNCAIAPRKTVCVIDDVITTGRHFKVMKRIILENWPKVEVVGLFWAKTIWRDHEE